MTVHYNIIMGDSKKALFGIILSFLLTKYMDILIFNVFKTGRHTTKQQQQLLHGFLFLLFLDSVTD